MNNGLVTCRNKAGTPEGLIVTSDRLYKTTCMDVGTVLLQGQYLTYCNRAIGIYCTKKSELKKIIFGFNWHFVLYSVLLKEEWIGFALNYTNFKIFPSTYIACFKSA